MLTLTIDKEFRQLIPPLTVEELTQLEQNIVEAKGARNPLAVWNGLLLDGHNRYDICQRLKLPFQMIEITVASRDDAKIWIIQNQFGRRNLSPYTRAELALRLEPLIAGRAKANQRASGGAVPTTLSKAVRPIDTRQEVAKSAKVSEGTLAKVKIIADKAPEAVKERLRRAETTINKEYKAIKQAEVHTVRQAALVKARTEQTETWGDLRVCTMKTLLTDVSRLDAIITDPPYLEEFIPVYGELAKYAATALKPNGVLAVMCGQMYLPQILALMTKYMDYRWTMAYLTPGGQPASIFPRKINAFWKPVLLFGGTDMISDVINNAANDRDKDFHKWGQNIAGFATLVDRLTKPGALVCDPFLGAGTTAIVCKQLARRFVGCDIDATAVETTQLRLAAIHSHVNPLQ